MITKTIKNVFEKMSPAMAFFVGCIVSFIIDDINSPNFTCIEIIHLIIASATVLFLWIKLENYLRKKYNGLR